METTTPWTRDKPTRSPFAMPSGVLGWLAGGLIQLLRRKPAGRIRGVDPSPRMRDLAAKRNRAETATGRVDLRPGTADHTGFPDAEFDCVVSVNTVAIWPDLPAGLTELHRVTRPGGRVLIAWHGGTRPSRIARGLALPEDQLAHIERELRNLFAVVTRHELTILTVWAAVRSPGARSTR